jgi:hypothetical protein
MPITLPKGTVELTLRKVASRTGCKEDGATETIEVTGRDAQAANKALELLGKASKLRLFIDWVEKAMLAISVI